MGNGRLIAADGKGQRPAGNVTGPVRRRNREHIRGRCRHCCAADEWHAVETRIGVLKVRVRHGNDRRRRRAICAAIFDARDLDGRRGHVDHELPAHRVRIVRSGVVGIARAVGRSDVDAVHALGRSTSRERSGETAGRQIRRRHRRPGPAIDLKLDPSDARSVVGGSNGERDIRPEELPVCRRGDADQGGLSVDDADVGRREGAPGAAMIELEPHAVCPQIETDARDRHLPRHG